MKDEGGRMNKRHPRNLFLSFILPVSSLVLERKERFELSSRVWKTRMFPATSLPHLWSAPADSRLVGTTTPALDLGVRTKIRSTELNPKRRRAAALQIGTPDRT